MGFLKRRPAFFLGLGITILFLGLVFARLQFLDSLELKLYDMRMGFRADDTKSKEVVLIDIDDDSIEKLGRWPWPRSLIARGINKITQGRARAVGLNFIFSEPEESAGLREITELERLFAQSILPRVPDKGEQFIQAIRSSQARLDNDGKLADALKESGRSVLPVFFKDTRAAAVAEDSSAVDSLLMEESIHNVTRSPAGDFTPRSNEITLPLPAFLKATAGLGHINLAYDMDGTARRERLLYEYRGLFIPSYTLRLAALYLGMPLKKIRARLGEEVRLGSLVIPTTARSELLVSFKGPRGSFSRFSYFDVLNDKVPLSVFRNKLVLVGASASGIMNPLSTPTDPAMPVSEFSAHVIWSIINSSFIQQPPWASSAELLLVLVLGIVISFLLPRLKAMWSGLVFVGLLVVLVGGSTFLFVSEGLWVRITYPLIQLILGYMGVVSIRYFITEVGKEKVEEASAETNRMLGLSFQTQGMLDMAWEKFRKVPVDDSLKDTLYNLALDFERKRMFNKAVAVYEYIEDHDYEFKDIQERKGKLIQAGETMVFGAGLGASAGGGLMMTGTDTRPTLGRYEVIKELGKGAMGVVYLGQDPRINRTTAIKTVRFTDDFDEDEADKLKEQFFREAESAGTLSHPHIVTIYDAGEEQELAYIAMELLEGEDLKAYTKKGNLLPMRKVIGYVADVADALDYAHQKGIVHRDVKPANIMLLESGVVKVTDFGIARITASSQTQTGVVKGTPYYMSPEQISGEKVDGRSDVFALGVVLYQLLTGELPFGGDNLAALMHQIMNTDPPDPRSHNPRIVKPLVTIINRALAKDKEKRYQRAINMAEHLRTLGKKMDEIIARKKAQKEGA